MTRTGPARPAVFLDRDGTLIEEKVYLSRPELVRLLPGVAQALRDLAAAGFACVVITNQSGLGRGLFTVADLGAVHEELTRQLTQAGAALDGFYFCPHVPATSDQTVIEHFDRKPGPGLLLRAAVELGLDLTTSWMVGDAVSDALAGRHAGCRGSILVRTGHPLSMQLAQAWLILDDFAAAARHIIQHAPG